MSKIKWRNGFAVGLAIGVLGTVLIVAYGHLASDLANCIGENGCEGFAAKYDGAQMPDWWWWRWTGELVTSGDTLANWVIAILTIVAVVLLWQTLVQTNKTNEAAIAAATEAKAANDIMRDEQRPWLEFEIVDWGKPRFQEDGSRIIGIFFQPSVSVRNRGASPALNVAFGVKVFEGGGIRDDGLFEAIADQQQSSDLPHSLVVFPGDESDLGKRLLGSGIFPAPGRSDNDHSINSWWFLAVLSYQYGGRSYFTGKMYSCTVMDGSEAMHEDNDLSILNISPRHWPFNDSYH